jgi:hypothetical protein
MMLVMPACSKPALGGAGGGHTGKAVQIRIPAKYTRE